MVKLLLASLLTIALQAQAPKVTLNNITSGIPVWKKYSVVAIADTVNGCANANGCWQVNGALGANKAAGLTQSIVLFSKPARGFVDGVRIKTAVAFTGTTSATATIGTATDDNFYTTALYNLKTAVSATNFSPADGIVQGFGGTTAAAEDVVLAIITTVENIDQIADGSAVDVWVKSAVLP